MLTYWFEDLVSELGIWNAFTQNHHRLTGKYLPFNLFPNDTDNKLLRNNLDFVLRFYKKDSYHTKPQITMV